jgi:phage terminase small subunit
MARGGYRPGSGPAKGTKYKTAGGSSNGSTKKEKVASKKNRLEAKQDTSSIPEDIQSDAAAEQMSPLDYMLKVMRDDNANDARRDRMAVSAAPFFHPRKGESGTGKKEEKASRAEQAGKGRFAPSRPPVALVK